MVLSILKSYTLLNVIKKKITGKNLPINLNDSSPALCELFLNVLQSLGARLCASTIPSLVVVHIFFVGFGSRSLKKFWINVFLMRRVKVALVFYKPTVKFFVTIAQALEKAFVFTFVPPESFSTSWPSNKFLNAYMMPLTLPSMLSRYVIATFTTYVSIAALVPFPTKE